MLGETDESRLQDKFSLESVMLRRITDYSYVRFETIMAAHRDPGTVVGFAIADLTEAAAVAGMRGLADAFRFIGDFVFGFFPDEALRSYLAPPMPFLFVPQHLGCDVSFTIDEIRSTLAGRSLQLKWDASASLAVGAAFAHFDGEHADDAIVAVIVGINEDLRSVFPGGLAAMPEDGRWAPRFPPDYLP